MSQFPINTEDGLYEAVNYLASGPSGLGQNFAGFSNFRSAYLTGNFRIPFSQLDLANLYVAPISISNAEQLDDRTIKYYFSGAPLAAAPFALGNGLTITGITPSTYNSDDLRDAGSSIVQIGVIECTDSYVIVRTRSSIKIPMGAYVSGGSISYLSTFDEDTSGYISTDCDARVTVTGGSDRVFISAQLTQTISYEVITGPCDLNVWVAINRYVGIINDDPVNPDYIFDLDSRVSRKIYYYTGLTGTGTLPELETIFTTVLDEPPPGYYRYIVEVIFEYPVGANEIQITSDEFGLRSLSAQVVKE
jgi:hypothetical protein